MAGGCCLIGPQGPSEQNDVVVGAEALVGGALAAGAAARSADASAAVAAAQARKRKRVAIGKKSLHRRSGGDLHLLRSRQQRRLLLLRLVVVLSSLAIAMTSPPSLPKRLRKPKEVDHKVKNGSGAEAGVMERGRKIKRKTRNPR